MRGPMVCLVVPLGGGPIDPGFGNIGGIGGWGGPRPDQGLPGGQGGYPSQPIYHPGHPDHGLPAYPDQGLPGGSGGHPSHPIHIPGVPDQGLPEGETIPSNELPPIQVPPDYADDLVIGVKQPNSTEWTFTAYDMDTQPDQGLPPTPAPKQQQRGRR